MTTRPTIDRPQAWPFPVASEARLSNGLRVLAYDRPGQHLAAVGVTIQAPLSAEPRLREGVATLVQRTLDEGTAEHPGESFGEALEAIGGSLDGHVGQDHSAIFLSVPLSRLEPAVGLLAEALMTPAFAEADVERHRSLRLAELDRVAAFPAQRAEVAFRHLVIDDESRAARLAGGSVSTVATISRDDVLRYHAQAYAPSNATVILAGAFADAPLPIIDRHFGHWTSAQTPNETASSQPGPGGTVLVDRPGSVHADVRLGGFSIDRHDPRWAPLRIATHIVGGEFLSRLNKVLREELGYTYGVSLAQRPLRQGGTFAVRGSFRTEVTGAAIKEAVRLLRVESFTPTEVNQAIDYFSGSSALRFATAAGVVGEVSTMVGAGLGPEDIDAMLQRYRAVTPEDALAAYRDVIDPDALSLAVVGSAAELSGPLTDAGFAPVIQSADAPVV